MTCGEFERAVERIRKLLKSPEIQVLREPGLDELLVESYIPGREVAIEGLLERRAVARAGDFRQARSARRALF